MADERGKISAVHAALHGSHKSMADGTVASSGLSNSTARPPLQSDVVQSRSMTTVERDDAAGEAAPYPSRSIESHPINEVGFLSSSL